MSRSESGGTNFHQHSDFSYLDGASTPEQICDRAKELGFGYVCFSDHGNVAGHIRMYDAARERGLVPVLGTELYMRDAENVQDRKYDNGKRKGFHLCVWAMNERGLHNVWAISSNSYYRTGDGHRNPDATWEDMEGHGEGVACTSACIASALGYAAQNNDEKMADYFCGRLNSIFEWFYIEIHTNSMPKQREVNLWLVKYAKKRGYKLVYAVDAHYARREDADFHDVWLGCQTKSKYDEDHWTMDHEYYMQGEDEVARRLEYLGDDLQLVFDGVDDFLSHVEEYELDTGHKVPRFPLPDGWDSSDSYLKNLVVRGMLKKVLGYEAPPYDPDDPEVIVVPSGLDTAENRAKLQPYVDQLIGDELPIVLDNGLSDYFLITADYIMWSKQHMMCGPGRGSCTASMVCYFLGITEIDPLGKGLIFSRFLNQGRLSERTVSFEDGTELVSVAPRRLFEFADGSVKRTVELSVGDRPVAVKSNIGSYREELSGSPVASVVKTSNGSIPDVDSDFDDENKPMVHEYLVSKYGEEYVTAVGTTTFFKMKSAVHEVCRYYRVPVPDTNRLALLVEECEELAGKGGYWRDALQLIDPKKREEVLDFEKRFPQIYKLAERMLGLARNAGKHAAGYVVSPMKLAEWLPVWKSPNDEIISQFDKVAVERMGFLKADVLGLRNLTTLRVAAEFAKERSGVDIDYYTLEEDSGDDAVWSIFEDGRTLSIFQMESSGLTAVAKRLRPRSVDELSTIVALYRPGVINAKAEDGETSMLEMYLQMATGETPVRYVVPELEPILRDTYATIVYQEQSMRIFMDLAGFTPTQADHIRAAIGKKKLAKMQAEKPKYLDGCERNGIPRDKAEVIWGQIEASASYAFNKAHSYAYATVAYWTAYMKAHYPIEWYAACMSTVPFDKAPLYIREARRRGIAIVPPALSTMTRNFAVTGGDEISFGIAGIKGVGDKVVGSILAGMPYSGFEDFVERSGANSAVVKTLIRADLFREVYPNAADLLHRYEMNDWQTSLFGESLSQEGRMTEEQPMRTVQQVVKDETELFGMPVSVDQFDEFRKRLGAVYDSVVASMDTVDAAPCNTSHCLLVRCVKSRSIVTKKGNMMAFFEFMDDRDNTFEATCFPRTYEVVRDNAYPGDYMMIEVRKQEYKGRQSLVLDRVMRMDRK